MAAKEEVGQNNMITFASEERRRNSFELS